jgi:hypothetical protein
MELLWYSVNIPLNQILYGPPEREETYNFVLEAAKIITGNEFISYDDAFIRFSMRTLNNQTRLHTFHRNYSYRNFSLDIRLTLKTMVVLTSLKKDVK